MKRLFIAFLSFCCIAVFAAEFVLAEKGKAAYSIVLPDNPEGFEKQAADDLKKYFDKMSGAKFEIVPESKAAGDKLIYVGKTAFAAKHQIASDKLTPEEWVIRPEGKNLILAGGYPIGSFYAVWQVLNKLGCYSLTWDQDAVPEYGKLAVDLKPEQKKPAFNGRLHPQSSIGQYRE